MTFEIGDFSFTFNGITQFVIRPTSRVLVVRPDGRDGYAVGEVHWGFKVPGKSQTFFNARSETIKHLPLWKVPFREGRCLVPACGFFESEERAGRKFPIRFAAANQGTLCMAGITTVCPGIGEAMSIVTTTPNAVVGRYHDRMPVLLDAHGARQWLHGDWGNLGAVMKPCPESWLTSYPVTPDVFKARFQSPEALKLWEPEKTLL